MEAQSPVGELLGSVRRSRAGVLDRDAFRQVGQRVVRARLVGNDVDRHAGQQLGDQLGAVADYADGPGPPSGLGLQRRCHGTGQVIGDLVQVACCPGAAAGRGRRR